MKRIVFYSILIFVFSIGIGYYYSNLWKKDNISTLQEQNILTDKNVITETVAKTEEKLGYNADFALKKYYDECGHYELNYAELPSELVNLTEQEIEDLYSNWTVEKFSENEVILAQRLEAMCDDHYVLKLGNENIEIYHILENSDELELVEDTNISKEYLTSTDIANLENGIYVYGKGNLNSALEDFE